MQIIWSIGMILGFILAFIFLIRSEILRSRQIKDLQQKIRALTLDSRFYSLESNPVSIREVTFLILDYLNLQLSLEARLKLIERKKSSK